MIRYLLCLFLLSANAFATVTISPGTPAATIQTALDNDGHVIFEKGTHSLSTHLNLTGSQTIEGERGTLIHCDGDFVHISGPHIRIADLRVFHSQPDQVSGTCFKFTGGMVSKLWVERVDVWRFEWGVDDYAMSGQNMLWHFKDCYFYYSKTRMRNAFGMCLWDWCSWVTTGDWPDADDSHFAGSHVEIFNNSGMNFRHCFVQSNGDLGNPNWVTGFRFVNSHAIEMEHCHADTIPGWGIVATGCKWLRLNQCKSGLCKNNAVWIDNCTRVTINGLNVSGRKNRGIPEVPNTPNVFIGPNTEYIISDLYSTHGTAVDLINPSIPIPASDQNGP